MRKFVRRLTVAVVATLAGMGFVTVATPGVGSADCGNDQWWDPAANVCRAPLINPPQ